MIIKFTYEWNEITLVNVPDSVPWIISYTPYDDEYEPCCLSLCVDERNFTLRDLNYFDDRPPYRKIDALYKSMTDEIIARLEQQPTMRFLDIDSLQNEIITKKFKPEWFNKGYLDTDSDGSW